MIKLTFLIIIYVISLIPIGQSDDSLVYYNQAMKYLVGDAKIGESKAKYSNIRVSTQIVPFDVLGWFYQTEITNKIDGYTIKSRITADDYTDDSRLNELSNFKKKSKWVVFFSSVNENLFLAEVLTESNSSDYKTASMFGKGSVFLFEINDGILKSAKCKSVHHN